MILWLSRKSFAMTDIDIRLLQAYSQGEITRREIADKHGSYVSFGALLGQLRAHRLRLPRVPSDPNNPGVQLVRKLAERAGPRVG